ncbi:MAG: hypothetical protein K0R49_432 [Burkholderiales bacterium]|jgi:hypothetical protein|nr:hypothetical protein [Burkholderiales bacterium]
MKKYIFSLFGILFLCINTAGAYEYGIGIINLPPELQQFLGKKEKLILRWQLSKDKEVTTTFEIGEGSRLLRPQVVFSNEIFKTLVEEKISQKIKDTANYKETQNETYEPELKSFGGIFHQNGTRYFFDYQITRVFKDKKCNWLFSVSVMDKNDQVLYMSRNIPILARVDYQFPYVEGLVFHIYSTDIEENKEDEKKLDELFRNLPSHDLSKVLIDIGYKVKYSNVQSYFCAFSVTDSNKEKDVRYLYWLAFTEPDPYGVYKTQSLSLFNSFTWDKNQRTLHLEINNIDTKFNLKPIITQPTSAQSGFLSRISIPNQITYLPEFKQNKKLIYMTLHDSVYEGKDLTDRYAICYTWPSRIGFEAKTNNTKDINVMETLVSTHWRDIIARDSQSIGGEKVYYYQCAFALDKEGTEINSISWLVRNQTITALTNKDLSVERASMEELAELNPFVSDPFTLIEPIFSPRTNSFWQMTLATHMLKGQEILVIKKTNPGLFKTFPLKKELEKYISNKMSQVHGFTKEKDDERWEATGLYRKNEFAKQPILCHKYHTIMSTALSAQDKIGIRLNAKTNDEGKHERKEPKVELKEPEKDREIESSDVRPRQDTLD